jgi:hypothetical protein
MAYNAKAGQEQAALKPDTIYDGVIINIEDKRVKDFLKPGTEWKGSVDEPCIKITMEVKEGEKALQCEKLFTYNTDGAHTLFSKKSNLGKFSLKYGKLPEVGDRVKCITNSEGYLNLKLD